MTPVLFGDPARTRASMAGVSFYPGISIYEPQAFGAQKWRQSVGYGYYGILVSGVGQTLLDYERMFRGIARGVLRGAR